ncbi:MAG: hypothetical protein ACFFG0_00355 [Candidatus Thorarchaeota archaeon]
MSELMIIEGMKKLRIIEKKMSNNAQAIQRYASMISTEKPLFETEDKQKKEIKSLIQSNRDLLDEYLDLKKRIEFSNLSTIVEMGGKKYSISDLLVIKRKLAKIMLETFSSLNTHEGESRKRSFQYSDQSPQVVRFYKEEDKIDGLKKWQDLYDNIESRLEVINATTPLSSLPITE